MHFLFSKKKFSDPLNTAVFTTIHVMKEGSPIVLVSHELDGDWQFVGKEAIEDYRKVAMVVSLESIIHLDKSVLKVADLPMGYCATRISKAGQWEIARIDYSEQDMREFGFFCSICGQYHKDIPMAFGAAAPDCYYLLPEADREKRCTLTQDQCIIDDRQFFIRGQIHLPVDERTDDFCWNVWVEVNEHDFDRMGDLWEDENRILEKPYTGKIATHLQPYPETIGLPVQVITQPVGWVPKVQLMETIHPLYLEQETGINMERVTAFAKMIQYQH